MEALPLALPRPREDDVVEVDGRDCTGIILELLAAADITHKKTSAGDGDGARADLLLRMLLEMPPSPMQRGNIDGDEGDAYAYCLLLECRRPYYQLTYRTQRERGASVAVSRGRRSSSGWCVGGFEESGQAQDFCR